MLAALQQFSRRRWLMAVAGAIGTALVVGLPTDVIPNPVFGRPVPVTWWSYPVLAITAILGGLLLATYVREPADMGNPDDQPHSLDLAEQRDARRGGAAGLLSFFAVGCPVCNKLVVIALGTVGAREWFEPIQPYLAALSIVLMAWALRSRLRYANACPVRLPATADAAPATVSAS
ncbi:MAG TPA: hypothetical protein DCR14_07720 [Acidimicrobiaceae bacterium]|nr:hypothetical protein [Acidimicrobiaceae bacterium]